MAELRAFRGLRYQVDPAAAGAVIAPPYDVISPQQQEALYERSPHNVIRLEYGKETGEARYRAAADALAQWRSGGVLAAEARPALYLYEQRFRHGGQSYTRRAVIGRVRLSPPEDGIIRPHEYTMSRPKADRLALLRATATNISPVYALVDDADGAFKSAIAALTVAPVIDAQDFVGQGHRLSVIDEPEAIARITAAIAARPLYIADGHHRYETALAYQREQQSVAGAAWPPDHPANFILMAITATDDPGLLILPIHRLVRPVRMPEDLAAALGTTFDAVDAGSLDNAGARAALMAAVRSASPPANVFGAAGITPGRLHLVTLRNRQAVEQMMPAEHPAAWRALDVNVLQYGILEPLLGIDAAALAGGEHVEFSEDDDEAFDAVRHGAAALALLVNATRPEQIVAVADAGDRMPQKSTYFYPKLGTGLVLNAHDVNG